jgi:hypothetical protein
MKTRLGIFAISLVVLPLGGLLLSGKEWEGLPVGVPAGPEHIGAVLWAILMLFAGILLVNYLIKRISGNSLLNIQRSYYMGVAAASAILCWLLAYLGLFADGWPGGEDALSMQLLLYTPLFALLAPAVLITRALLGSFSGLLKWLAHGLVLPVHGGESIGIFLVSVAVLGLLGGGAWPAQMGWLMWFSPLLLLTALQLLWNESTIFSGLKSGDWGRLICAALAGMIVGNLVSIIYHAGGGNHPAILHNMPAQLGYILFGLLCLQLGDVIAENWRGKKRAGPFQQKKKFPIPVIARPVGTKRD